MIYGEVIETDTGCILYDRSVAGFSLGWFDTEARQSMRNIGSEPDCAETHKFSTAGRTPAVFFTIKNQEFAIKHYMRGGMIRRLMHDYYVYQGRCKVRSFIEWQILYHAQSLLLPVPRPIAARYCCHGLFYSADLITQSCRPAKPLSQLLLLNALPEQGWRQIGLVIRQFHDCGICHADLNASNILLKQNGSNWSVTILDFDKARRYKVDSAAASSGNQHWQLQNLHRLRRSLTKWRRGHLNFCFNSVDFDFLLSAWAKVA